MYRRAYTSVKNNCFTPMLEIFVSTGSPTEIVGAKVRNGIEITFFDHC